MLIECRLCFLLWVANGLLVGVYGAAGPLIQNHRDRQMKVKEKKQQKKAQAPADVRLYYIQRPAPIMEGLAAGSGFLQSYFPSMEVLFPSLLTNANSPSQTHTNPTLAAKELAVSVSREGTAVVEDLVSKVRRETPIWLRKIHLVEPIDFMSGEYVLPVDGALPAPRAAWQAALRKVNDPYNEAYTDVIAACMASRLVETGRSPHFVRFYGSVNCRLPEYSYSLTDDMPDIEDEDWFREGLKNGTFRVIAYNPWDPNVQEEMTTPFLREDVQRRLASSSSQCESISLSSVSASASASAASSASASDVESDLEEIDLEISGEAQILRRPALRLERLRVPSPASSPASSSDEDNSDDNSDESDESDENRSDESEESDDDVEFKAILPNFPAQVTIIERCDGTMDDLMEDEVADDVSEDMKETKEKRWTAWMFQVIAGLATAQQIYELIHNDLHTNNVMWSGTGETHLYYHVVGGVGGDRYYRVPTYGRIMKIIDFGRATFRPPTSSTLWIPDAYAPGADAAGQYNCGAYLDQDRPKIQPNTSFDLCRLAVAMIETLWDSRPSPVQPQRILTKEPGMTQYETESPLWNLLWLWLTDKHGRNVLRTPDGEERYPNFDLYCAIARDSNNAVPAQQLTLPLFDEAFRCAKRDIPTDAQIYAVSASR